MVFKGLSFGKKTKIADTNLSSKIIFRKIIILKQKKLNIEKQKDLKC